MALEKTQMTMKVMKKRGSKSMKTWLQRNRRKGNISDSIRNLGEAHIKSSTKDLIMIQDAKLPGIL